MCDRCKELEHHIDGINHNKAVWEEAYHDELKKRSALEQELALFKDRQNKYIQELIADWNDDKIFYEQALLIRSGEHQQEKAAIFNDIKEMLIVISAFTEEDTHGEDLLNKWQKKYLGLREGESRPGSDTREVQVPRGSGSNPEPSHSNDIVKGIADALALKGMSIHKGEGKKE